MDIAQSSAHRRIVGFLGLAALLSASTGSLAGQAGTPLSREIWFSDAAHGFELELERRTTPFRVEFKGGQITVGNDVIGRYIIDDLLDRAWRALMRRATDVSDAEIGALLVDWSPPAGLNSSSADVAAQLDAALELAFEGINFEVGVQEAAARSLQTALESASQAGEAAVAAQQENVQRLETQVRNLERDLRRTRSRSESRARGWWSHVTSGLRGLLATFVTFLILAGGGWIAVRMLPSRFEAASAAVRRRPLAVFGAGLAGAFLTPLVFIVGIVCLAFSIVGIVAIPFWFMGYPLLVFGMVVFGYLVFARVLGEWVSDRAGADDLTLSGTSPFGFLIAGVLVIMSFSAVASLVGMFGPWLHWLAGLLMVLGSMFTMFATVMGFGAVILTRGGRWEFAGKPDGDGVAWQEVDVAWDVDPDLTDSPFDRSPLDDLEADSPAEDADAPDEDRNEDDDQDSESDDGETGPSGRRPGRR